VAPASTLPIRSKELSLRRIHKATAINPVLCAARSKRRCGSALAKVTVNVWSLQPYHLIRQAAVLTDPLADIRRVGAPQLLRVERGSGPVETKIRIGHHADASARNVAHEQGACGYARAHDPNLYSLCCKRAPLILISTNKATVQV